MVFPAHAGLIPFVASSQPEAFVVFPAHAGLIPVRRVHHE